MTKKKGKGKGWHGDSAGHAAAARKAFASKLRKYNKKLAAKGFKRPTKAIGNLASVHNIGIRR